jgi:hypothetical protein
VGVVIAFFAILGFLIVSPHLNKVPSCTDNTQNGDEKGIDCGGSCTRACTFEVDQISILWARAFEVIPGRYNAVAYLENHNKNSVISKIRYSFRFSDKNNLFIGKREGETFIPAGRKFAVFEPGIGVGNSIPVYTTFQFTETPVWTTVSIDKLNQLKVLVSDAKLENQDTSPHLTTTIKNDSFFNIPELSVIALLYDEKGNVVSASSTYLDMLTGGESKNLDFTWMQPIPGNIVAKEIIPLYNVFLVKLK